MWLFLFLLLQAPQASVRGHVTADNGAPVGKAEVILRRTRGPNLRKTATDAQGGFEFREVEPGNYTLTVSKPGLLTWNYGQTDFQTSAVVRVGASEQVGGVDFKVPRTGAISGTVTGEDGEPLRNVSVRAVVRNYRWGTGELAGGRNSTTDDRGQYRIFDLEPGRYYVLASLSRLPSSVLGQLVPVFYRSGASIENAQAVPVAAGADVAHIDLVLRAGPSYSVSGTVVDGATGKPASGGSVNIVAASPIRGGGAIAGSPIQKDGSFQVSGILPGTYRLNGNVPDPTGPRSIPFSRWLEVGGGDVTGLVVTLNPAIPVRGHVVAEGGPLPEDLRVALIDRKERPPVGASSNAPVSKDGSFEIRNVQPGEYDVVVDRVSTSRFVFFSDKFYVREVRSSGKDFLEQGVSIPESLTTPELEIVIDFHSGTVSGSVVDDRAAPIPGAIVVLASVDAKKRASDRFFRVAMTRTVGNYEFSGVIPGEYRLVVWPSLEYYRLRDPEVFQAVEKHALSLTVAKDAEIKQDLRILPAVQAVARGLR